MIVLVIACAGGPHYATEVVSFAPGENAGYGAESLPDVVLGPPSAGAAPSLDVLSLGREGEIVLGFDVTIVDRDGPDLVVYENPMAAWPETGIVAVSVDGEAWDEFPCDPLDEDGGFPGCAGVAVVTADTDGAPVGGDAFDLADLGVDAASFVRIRDSGANAYAMNTGGFDLDAVGVLESQAP